MTGVAVRVLSYNVRSLRDDRAAVAAVIRAIAPDVACVQEAPRFLGSRRQCARMAGSAGLVVITGGRAAAGNLLLGGRRARALVTEDLRLPRQGRRHRRGAALAVVEVDGMRLAVAGSHLSLSPGERLGLAGVVLARLGALAAPHVVLGADGNDIPGSPVWAALTTGLRDAHALAPTGGPLTFPARAPDRRIDGIFVAPSVTVLGCGVPENLPDLVRASDHLPVVAELVLSA